VSTIVLNKLKVSELVENDEDILHVKIDLPVEIENITDIV
jgi:hypothetical protein